jgi:hypothetical protein
MRYRPFIIAAFIYVLIFQVALCVWGVPPALEGRADFKAFYSAGYIVRTGRGGELYDYAVQQRTQQTSVSSSGVTLPFQHAPYEALLFAPLSAASYRTAYWAFFAFNLILLAATAVVLDPLLPRLKESWRPLVPAMVLLFMPAGFALIQGQDSILLLLLFACCYSAAKKDRDFLSGCLLALGLFKFQITLPFVVALQVWRRARLLAGFVSCAAVLGLVSLWVVRPQGVSLYTKSLLEAQSHLAQFEIVPEMMINLRGLIYATMSGLLSGNALVGLTLVVSGLLLAWAASRATASFESAVVVATLASYHLMVHDASLLILPLLIGIEHRPSKALIALSGIFFAPPVYIMLASHKTIYLLAAPLSMLLIELSAPERKHRDSPDAFDQSA